MRLLLSVLLCVTLAKGWAQQSSHKKIVVSVIDAETKLPIKDFKLEVIHASLGTGSFWFPPGVLIGTTDECGFVETSVPLSLAYFSGPDGPQTDVFSILLTHCIYGQTIRLLSIHDGLLIVEMEKPFVYDIKGEVNEEKTAVTLTWRARKMPVRVYKSPYSAWDDRMQPGNIHVWAEGRAQNEFLFNGVYYANELYSVTDTNIGGQKQITYTIEAVNFNAVPGCTTNVEDSFTIDVENSGTDPIVVLPRATIPCVKLITPDTLFVGNTGITSEVTANLDIFNIGQADALVSSLTTGDGFFGSLTPTVIAAGSTFTLPITFRPQDSKEYTSTATIFYGSGTTSTLLTGFGFAGNEKITVYPTVYQDVLTIQVDSEISGSIEVTVLSAQGAELHEATIMLDPVKRKYDLRFDNIAPGLQIIRLKNQNSTSIARVVKL